MEKIRGDGIRSVPGNRGKKKKYKEAGGGTKTKEIKPRVNKEA